MKKRQQKIKTASKNEELDKKFGQLHFYLSTERKGREREREREKERLRSEVISGFHGPPVKNRKASRETWTVFV